MRVRISRGVLKKFCLLVIFVSVFYSIFCGAPLGAEGSRPGRYSAAIKIFENFIRERMACDRAVGISAAFMKDDFTWAGGFGYADLENEVPAKPGSSYRLASVSKTFTAVAVLQLVEKGKIDLDAEVQVYVPYFPEKKWPVSIRHLLGHLAGISHYRDYDKEGHIKVHKNTQEALEIFSGFDLVAEPGTYFNYSSYGYNLLAAVVESVSGLPFGKYLRENIFAPLGMADSMLDSPADLIPNRVRGYRLVNGKIANSEFIDISSRLGAGAARSTVVDLLKFAAGILSNKLLKQAATRRMFSAMVTKSGYITGYGMGWRIVPYHGHFHVSHGGGQPETSTYLLILPELKFAVAMAANLEELNLLPYVNRLAELILQEDIDSRVFSASPEIRAILSACEQTFYYGMAYYEKNHSPLGGVGEGLKQAFAFFNRVVDLKALKTNYRQLKFRIDAGVHPAARQAFTRIGSFMAAELEIAYGEEKLKAYNRRAFFSFFHDFMKISSQWPAGKRNFTFSKRFARTFSPLHRDWQKTYNDYVRSLVITCGSDFAEIGEELKKIFSKAGVYPNFRGEMARAAYTSLFAGNMDRAVDIFRRRGELYPDPAGTASHLAFAYLWGGKADRAGQLFKKAFKTNRSHPGLSPNRFEWYGKKLEDRKKTAAAAFLIDLALDLYPGNPDVLKRAGDFYLAAGEKKKARSFYRRALKLKPGFAEVKEILERLEQKKK